MFEFECSCLKESGRDVWYGDVSSIRGSDGHYHIKILSRSTIFMILGKSDMGTFACIPDFNAGCYLGRLDHVNYNADKLTYAMKNRIDAITVAVALNRIRNKVLL